MSANSGSISSVNYLLFHLSFTVLFTIAKHAILSQEDGSPSADRISAFRTVYIPPY